MPLTLAVISTSRIVDEFLANAAAMPEISVQALCCRPQSRPKAEAWAAQYSIPAVYTDEDACYAAGGFDAVYIGTANHLHYAAAKRALNAGYHVILEKPFVSTAAEARELFALADAKGLVLFEAITIPYMPQFACSSRQQSSGRSARPRRCSAPTAACTMITAVALPILCSTRPVRAVRWGT